VALHRHEPINALWIVTAAVCIYLLGYRLYAAWIAARVLSVDASRATPAERLNNGRDFVPTHRVIVFGHHFAAIAGPGPLVVRRWRRSSATCRGRCGSWWVQCWAAACRT